MWIGSEPSPFPSITLEEWKDLLISGPMYDIRGVAFPHTASTELYATAKVNSFLSHLNMIPANVPVGMWIYGPLKDDSSPLIEKAVGLFETVSDKRLENHLLAGFERFIESSIPDDVADAVLAAFAPRYTSGGLAVPSNANRTHSRFFKLSLRNVLPFIRSRYDSTEGGPLPGLADDDLAKCGILNPADVLPLLAPFKIGEFSLQDFAALHCRLGWEAGRSLAAVHRCGFLWGSYGDRFAATNHCNSHCDNFVVLPAPLIRQHHQVLSPLDFDMAINFRTAVNYHANPPVAAPDFVEEQFFSELKNLSQDIGGESAINPNTFQMYAPRQQPTKARDPIVFLMRDFMAFCFFRGYTAPLDTNCPGYDLDFETAIKILDTGLKITDQCNS
jgi:hypothetical protein